MLEQLIWWSQVALLVVLAVCVVAYAINDALGGRWRDE